jgi:hypothetical protein
MRIHPRRVLAYLVAAGVAGAILIPLAVYSLGLALAPRPVPAAAHVPPLFADALWARVGGGRATAMKPLGPFSIGRFVGCLVVADLTGDGQDQSPQTGTCSEVLPAMHGVEQLSRAYLVDARFESGRIQYPFGQFATSVWLTRNWTKAELLDALAERARFGFGLRGAETASRYYFDRPVAELTLPQAALLASLGIGEKDVNPWGEPELAAEMRNRVLAKMRDSDAIDTAAYENAMRSSLDLGPERPPPSSGGS